MKWLLTLFLFAAAACAEDLRSSGAGAHVCGTRVELYDFYEGKQPTIHNLSVWKENPELKLEHYISLGLARVEKLSPDLHVIVRTEIEQLLSQKDQLIINKSGFFLSNADIAMVDEGCTYEQVTHWSARFHRMFIRKKLYDLMSPLSQAGLWFHEAIAKISRDSRIKDNFDNTRRVVAKIFSDEALTFADSKVIWSDEALVHAQGKECTNSMSFAANYMQVATKMVALCKKDPGARGEILKMKADVMYQMRDSIKTCQKTCLSPRFIKVCDELAEMPDKLEAGICQ